MLGVLWAYARYRDLPGQYEKYRDSEAAVRELRGRVETLRQQQKRLEGLVAGLDKDPVEWEAAIRRHKGLVREGEKVYRIEGMAE